VTERTSGAVVQVRELFDSKAAAWPSKYAQGGRLAGRLAQFAAAAARHVAAGGSVLDLGCGTGELTMMIAANGMRTTGCDISPEMLRVAAAAGASRAVNWVELEPGWEVLPFPDRAFDAVIASSVFEYVGDPAAVLRECSRVLRPGGVVLCTVPDPRHPVRWLEWPAGIVAGIPAARSASRRWPRLGAYLTYLDISQQRHLSRWWRAVATRSGLVSVRHLAEPSDRSPLRMFVFQRVGEGRASGGNGPR
jgi:SAM-dependent methyltransferase